MKQVTKEEWAKIPSDYKVVRPDGSKAMLVLDPEHGTCLIPVEVVR